jgi:hypothetical protein
MQPYLSVPLELRVVPGLAQASLIIAAAAKLAGRVRRNPPMLTLWPIECMLDFGIRDNTDDQRDANRGR